MEAKLQERRLGENDAVIITVNELVDGETIVDASAEVRSRFGVVLVENHAIKLSPMDNGYVGLIRIGPIKDQKRVFINFYVTTSYARKQFVIPLDPTYVEVKISASRKRFTVTAQVVATKQ